MNKEKLRVDILSALRSLSSEEIQSLNISVTNQIIKFFNKFPEFQSQSGAGYLAMHAEVAPDYQRLSELFSFRIGYPVLENNEMEFGISSSLPEGGVWLKPPYSKVKPDWALVPGVGFDLKGARLGRGKGYYDRYLAGSKAKRIGLCWNVQLKDNIPVESHDCHMDFIITENFCWDVSRQEKF